MFVLTRLGWIGMIIYTASLAICAMTGWELPWVMLAMGMVTTIYTSVGGIEAVIWTDFAQFLILLGGAVLIPVSVAYQTGVGPAGWWESFAASGRTEAVAFSLDPTVRITIVGVTLDVFLWYVCTNVSDQVAVQRYLATPSAAAASRSVWVFSAATVAVQVLLVLSGIALFYFYFGQGGGPAEATIQERADELMPQYIAEQLPRGLSGLVLAALLAAAMSSISSGINSISTVISVDFLERRSAARPAAANLRRARRLSVLTGLVGINMALAVYLVMERNPKWKLLDMIAHLNHLFVAPLGAIFILGILAPRVGAAAALLGFAAGTAVSFLVSFSKDLFGLEISFTWIMPASFLVSVTTSYLAALFFPPPSPGQIASLRPNEEMG